MLPILVASAWLSVSAESLSYIQWQRKEPTEAESAEDELNDPIAISSADTKQWQRRGGPELWLEAALVGSYSASYSRRRNAPLGLGVALRAGVLFLRVPDIDDGDAALTGFRTGLGVELPYAILFETEPAVDGRAVLRPTSLLVQVPVFIGGQWSFGRFINRKRWEGWTIAFDANPSITISTGRDLSLDDLQLLAARLQLARTHYTLSSRRWLEPQWSVSVSAALGGTRRPLLLTLSLGYAWF